MPEIDHEEQLQDLASDAGMTIVQVPYNWEPWLYQDDLWQYFLHGGDRGCACCHRRWGKDLFAINLIGVKNQERPGLYWHMFPEALQARKTVWDGVTNDGRPFLDHFPGFRTPGAPGSLVATKREDLMQIKFRPTRDPVTLEMRESGGVYQLVGLDNPDSTVGPNPFGIVYSEWSICPERAWHLHKPMLNANNGWALFIFTMRGRNHAWKMIQKAKKSKRWFVTIQTVDDTYKLEKTTEKDENGSDVYVPRPVVSQEQIAEDRADGMPEETIQSEYYCSADAPMPGSYYGARIDVMEACEKDAEGLEIPNTERIRDVAWEPNAEVFTMWDIGHDGCAIIAAQAIAREIHLINFYENSGEGFSHYIAILRNWEKQYGYIYSTHYGPHDLQQREFMASDGRHTKLDQARKLGVKFTIVPKHSLEDGINETRSFLMRCWADKTKCEKLIEAVRAYRKEWDEKHQCFKEVPVHDWASHPADALRQGAMGFKEVSYNRRKKQGDMSRAKTDYNEHRY